MHTGVSNFASECLTGARVQSIRLFRDGRPFFELALEMQFALFVIIDLNVQESPNSVQVYRHATMVCGCHPSGCRWNSIILLHYYSA